MFYIWMIHLTYLKKVVHPRFLQGLSRDRLDTSFWTRRSYVPSGDDVVLRRPPHYGWVQYLIQNSIILTQMNMWAQKLFRPNLIFDCYPDCEDQAVPIRSRLASSSHPVPSGLSGPGSPRAHSSRPFVLYSVVWGCMHWYGLPVLSL